MTRFVRNAASAAALLALAACGGGDGGGGITNPPPGGQTTEINMSASSFNPISVTVPVGRQVVWTNGSGVPHTVTPDNAAQAGAWASAQLAAGGTFQHTFNTAGTYNYHCNFHNGMTGTITVQ